MNYQHTTPKERALFVDGYTEALLWSTQAYREGDEGDSQTPHDSCIPVAPELHAAIETFALEFLDSNERALDLAARDGRGWDYLGHDAHLTREGHGSGFWDRGDIRKPLRDILTDAAFADRSEVYLWVAQDEDGDDIIRGDVQ